MSEAKRWTKTEVIARQLAIVEDAEMAIQQFKKNGDNLMTRQYEHLKKKYLDELNELLKNSRLKITFIEEI